LRLSAVRKLARFRVDFLHLRHGAYRVAYIDRAQEAQCLREVDGGGVRGQRANGGRDEPRAQHAVNDALAKASSPRVFRVAMQRIGVATDLGELADVVSTDRFRKLGQMADVHARYGVRHSDLPALASWCLTLIAVLK